jgi:hypothetical protein
MRQKVQVVPRGTIGKVQAAYPSLADITTGVRQSVHWPYSSQVRPTVLSIQRDIAAKRPVVGYDFTMISKLVAAELVMRCLFDRSTALYFYKRLKTSLHKPRGNLLENLFSKKCAFKNDITFRSKFIF